jgi:hypothetical protein
MKSPSFLLCCAVIFSAFGQSEKAWTIVTYLAADNDLNEFAEPNIQQMMQAGSNEDRNILIYLAETKQGKKYGKLLRVEKDSLVELATDNNVDSGSRDVCFYALQRAFAAHPAKHNALIFWNHGSGSLNMPFADLFKGIAYDEGLDTYLTDQDVVSILHELSETVFGGKKLDILGFDACLMAGIELQAPCASYVDYYVAAEEVEEGPGWDYAGALSSITRDSRPQEVVQQWVNAFATLYDPVTERYTLSGVDLATIVHLASNVDEVAKTLVKLLELQSNQEIVSLLQLATHPTAVTCFDKPDKPDYIDLDHLYANMLEQIELMGVQDNMQYLCEQLCLLLRKGRNLIQQSVLANVVGKRHARARGISIYWAQEKIHGSYGALAWTDRYPYWERLMHAYLSSIQV